MVLGFSNDVEVSLYRDTKTIERSDKTLFWYTRAEKAFVESLRTKYEFDYLYNKAKEGDEFTWVAPGCTLL